MIMTDNKSLLLLIIIRRIVAINLCCSFGPHLICTRRTKMYGGKIEIPVGQTNAMPLCHPVSPLQAHPSLTLTAARSSCSSSTPTLALAEPCRRTVSKCPLCWLRQTCPMRYLSLSGPTMPWKWPTTLTSHSMLA